MTGYKATLNGIHLADKLEALAKKASPGPWSCQFKPVVRHTAFAYLVPPTNDSLDCVSMGSNRMDGSDQEFVIALIHSGVAADP